MFESNSPHAFHLSNKRKALGCANDCREPRLYFHLEAVRQLLATVLTIKRDRRLKVDLGVEMEAKLFASTGITFPGAP